MTQPVPISRARSAKQAPARKSKAQKTKPTPVAEPLPVILTVAVEFMGKDGVPVQVVPYQFRIAEPPQPGTGAVIRLQLDAQKVRDGLTEALGPAAVVAPSKLWTPGTPRG